MKKENTSSRLKKIMSVRGIKQVDILNLTMPYCEKYGVKMNKSDISQYVNGKAEPNQDKLAVLSMALGVDESWLMGFDVPIERNSSKSVHEIIQHQLRVKDLSLEDIAQKAKVSLAWLKNIDSFIPGSMEFMFDDPCDHENPALDWDDEIGGYKSYEWITRVAEAIDLPASALRAALARQEIPIPDNLPTSTPEEDFGNIDSRLTNIIDSYRCLNEDGTLRPDTYELEMIEKYRTLDTHGTEMVDYVLEKEYDRCQLKEDRPDLTIAQQDMRVVRYYQRMASAGTGQVVFEDMPTERIQIPDIPEYRCVSYAIGVNGDSMEPLYYDGDILLIETTLQIEVGEIGIFIVDGEAFVKQLGEGKLISLNKKYKDIPLTECSNCMGRVVGKLEVQ